MWKIFFCMTLALGIFISAEKVSAASLHERPSIAALPYVNKAAVSPELELGNASIVTEMVIEQLLDTNRFRFVTRENLQSVIDEIAYSHGGMVDASMVLQAGKQLGAQFLIAGSIAGLSTKPSGVTYSDSNLGGAGFNKMAVVANVTIRFIDVETGEIVLAASGTGESSRTNAEFTLKRKTEEFYETDTVDDGGYEMPSEEIGTSTSKRKLTIGGESYSLVQVRNALYKAVGDMIYNKNFGVLAKLDGKSKRRKV